MRDLKETLSPNETVLYQYAYPLWMKILAGAALLVVAYTLYDDFRAGRNIFVMLEVAMLAYLGYWLWIMQRDSGQYVVTDRRVMRLGGQPGEDQIIQHPEIDTVSVLRDNFSGSTLVEVKAQDQRMIRVPVPGTGRARALELVMQIDKARGHGPDADSSAAADASATTDEKETGAKTPENK